LVIFDCDGVLIDSEPIANRVLAGFITRAGIPLSVEACQDLFLGRTMTYVWEWLARTLGHPLPPEWIEAFDLEHDDVMRLELRPVQGVLEVVDELMARGIPTCVASQGRAERVRRALAYAGFAGRFEDLLFTADLVSKPKPAPDLFLHAARQLGFAPGDTVVIEDTVVGVTAAVAAGMRVLGYAERSAPDRLRAAGAEVFTRMDALPELLALPEG
jgi:HAD superfamily hydrolase (TIGR01509 family)